MALMAGIFAAGCVHPPKYEPPKTVTQAAYKEQGADLLQPAQPTDHAPRPAWWETFNDPKLNELETRLMTSNPTLAQAVARYAQAAALIRENRSQFYPQVGVSGGVLAGRPSSAQGGTTDVKIATDYTLRGDFAWEADLWGRIRQTVSVAVANAQATAGDREALKLSLAAQLATTYFALRTFDAEIVLLNETTQAYEKSYQLTQNQYNAGLVARADVAQAQTLLEGARAQSIDVSLQRAQAEHAIAVLMGEMPAALAIDTMPISGEPPRLPPEMPSRLLERRPDIAAAERRVAAANSQIGVATSAFFPTLGISASVGLQTTTLQKLLSWPAGFWSVGPTLAYQLFDGGARRAVKAGAVAAYDVTIGSYRETVLVGVPGRRRQPRGATAAGRGVRPPAAGRHRRAAGARHLPESVPRGSHQLSAGGHRAGAAAEQPAQRALYHRPPLRRRGGPDPRPRRRMGRTPGRWHGASGSAGAADGTRARGASGAVITGFFGLPGTRVTPGF